MFRNFCCTLIAVLAITLASSCGLADDVRVSLNNGDVFVSGDNDSNDVQIFRVYRTLHMFRGLNGTTINGSSSAIVFPIQDDLVIELEGGHDSLDITSLRANAASHADVHIEMGDGDDEVFVNNANIARHLIISADRGVDPGNDNVELEDVTVGRFLIADLSDGLDRFFAIDCLVQRAMEIEADGIATIICQRNIADEIIVDSGVFGPDVIRILDNDTTGIELQTSNERDDVLFLSNSITAAGGFVNLGGGNDVLDFRFNQLGSWGLVPGIYTVSGGSGRDTGIISDNGLFGLMVFQFEGTIR